ncbi:MAG: T9SS type A sorting domain-containing protein [Imperialibacter sp.]|uniref:T9SS type A sorting domain-containing protein n=1 Tax=Imperialibacter sp. TaxID=2038411 RepID=UPI0032ECEF77
MKNTLKIVFTLVIAALSNLIAVGQTYSTKNNYTGNWSAASSWVSGSQPDPLTTNIDDNINVYGYVSVSGSLSFTNVNEGKDFYIYDTLVVFGNLTFANKAHNFYVQPGAVLVVFGDFSATNKITVANGGTIAITGDMSFSASGQDTFTPSSGSGLYVDGTVSGNANADAVDQPSSALQGSNPALYNFIVGGGSTPLPIVLSYFKGVNLKNAVKLSWETASEENFDHFEIQRSFDGKDFEVIATEKGNGFTSEKHQYSFTDTNPEMGINYYRLNAIDFDGSSEIFETIAVEVAPDFSSVAMYPNPNNGTELQLNIPEELLYTAYNVTMTVSDLQGRVVTTREITSAHVSTAFDQTLATGIYLVTIQAGKYSSTYRLMVNQG